MWVLARGRISSSPQSHKPVNACLSCASTGSQRPLLTMEDPLVFTSSWLFLKESARADTWSTGTWEEWSCMNLGTNPHLPLSSHWGFVVLVTLHAKAEVLGAKAQRLEALEYIFFALTFRSSVLSGQLQPKESLLSEMLVGLGWI